MRWLFLVVLMIAASAAPAQDVGTAIKTITEAEAYKNARWGILIVDAKTGATVYSRNANTMFAPASVTKLFSGAAALTTLGADYKFETPVYAVGKVEDGKLTGDLVLVAKGDLTFGGRSGKDGITEFKNDDHTYADGTPGGTALTDTDPLAAFKDLAKQVKAAGITSVTGDVLIDDRMFVTAEGSGSGPKVISPMLANDNLIDITITPGEKAGDKAIVVVRPQTAFLNKTIDVTTVEKVDKDDKKERVVLNTVDSDPQSYVLRGQIPLGTKPIVVILSLPKPVDYARTLFIEALKAEGVRVDAPVVRHQVSKSLPKDGDYVGMDPVAKFTSRPFDEMLKVTLKVSHNLYASTFPLLVASKMKSGRTLSEGLKAQGKALKEIGIDPKDISFGGGAGGDRADHVTPRVTVELLQAMRKRPEWAVYKDALPILGIDGTLASSVPSDSPAKGHAFAKTGTLSYTDHINGRMYLTSKALAGVMTTKSGRELTFAIFLNDRPLPSGVKGSSEGKTLGKICEAVYENVK